MMDHLRGAQVFSKIELRLGDWQMLVRDEDVPKTTFWTRWDPGNFGDAIGITNAPSLFMNLVQDILQEYLDDFLIVFIDNILISPKPLNNMLNT